MVYAEDMLLMCKVCLTYKRQIYMNICYLKLVHFSHPFPNEIGQLQPITHSFFFCNFKDCHYFNHFKYQSQVSELNLKFFLK